MRIFSVKYCRRVFFQNAAPRFKIFIRLKVGLFCVFNQNKTVWLGSDQAYRRAEVTGAHAIKQNAEVVLGGQGAALMAVKPQHHHQVLHSTNRRHLSPGHLPAAPANGSEVGRVQVLEQLVVLNEPGLGGVDLACEPSKVHFGRLVGMGMRCAARLSMYII